MLENDVKRQVSDYLAARGYMFWRNNTGAMVSEYKGKKRFFQYGKVGSGDIFGLTKQGIFFSIELKVPGRYPTDSQKEFMATVKATGGIAFVARSVEDVIANGL